jgi:hypothetical protein
VRRLFPAITDNAEARACARTVAGSADEAVIAEMRVLPGLVQEVRQDDATEK